MRKNRLLRIYELHRGFFFPLYVGVRHRETTSFPEWPKKDTLPRWAGVSSVGKCVQGDAANLPFTSDCSFSCEFCSVPVMSSLLKGTVGCQSSVDCGVLPRSRQTLQPTDLWNPVLTRTCSCYLIMNVLIPVRGIRTACSSQLLASVGCWTQFPYAVKEKWASLLRVPLHVTLGGARGFNTTILTAGTRDVQGAVGWPAQCFCHKPTEFLTGLGSLSHGSEKLCFCFFFSSL